jgi:predicted DNA-binding protein (MmcQ/YjbR family)
MPRDVHQAVRDLCLWLPESEEFLSHGSPTFKVRGKTFATYVINHHGDGRVALWLNAVPGSQEAHMRADPARFFIPPYVGPRGWLGVLLNRGTAWTRVGALVREAYEKVAPSELRARLGKTPAFAAPIKALSASEVDPFNSPPAIAVLKELRALCGEFPETRETRRFGCPAWLAGKKTFVLASSDQERLSLLFWVGADNQGLLLSDPRYRIPPYMGHNGWIALDISGGCDWDEIAELAATSFRHFALKRMLQQLSSV